MRFIHAKISLILLLYPQKLELLFRYEFSTENFPYLCRKHKQILKYVKGRKKNVCISNTRIEPVGKPYREVCLRSELCLVMAHQPNSWSKHPGTGIEQVLAYCRDEQKYVGCIELSFCLTVTMTFGVRT